VIAAHGAGADAASIFLARMTVPRHIGDATAIQSVKLQSAPDGFSVRPDSDNQRNNQANGNAEPMAPRPSCWKRGWEGDDWRAPARCWSYQASGAKLFSLADAGRGTPCSARHEFLNTQGGNNNQL